MNHVEVITQYHELVREATHKEMWIQLDEYRDEFLVYDFTEKPAKHVGTCKTLDELMSIIHDTWKDENGNWIPKQQEQNG